MAQRGRGTAAGARPDLGALRSRLRGLVEPIVAREGLDLEDLTVSPAGRRYVVRITVDGDGGVGHDELSDVSREISTGLDEAERTQGELTPDAYTLEVSSPGIDRPLTLPRHWRRNVGRLVAVPVGPGGADQMTGRITGVDDDGVTLAVEAPGKPGAKKRPPTAQRVPWSLLGAGRVQVEFGRAGDDAGTLGSNDEDDRPDDEGDGGGR